MQSKLLLINVNNFLITHFQLFLTIPMDVGGQRHDRKTCWIEDAEGIYNIVVRKTVLQIFEDALDVLVVCLQNISFISYYTIMHG
jgi:hypothetical protein